MRMPPKPADFSPLFEGDFGAASRVLTARERIVLCMRCGLDGGPRLSLGAIGSEMGISQERVRQLQTGALRKLRGYHGMTEAQRPRLDGGADGAD